MIWTYVKTGTSQEHRNKETVGDYSNEENQVYKNDSEINSVIKELAESIAFLSELLEVLSAKLGPVLKLDNPSADLQEYERNSVLQSPLAIQINSINGHLTESAIKRVQTILFDLAL